jgi:hypothetical protein
MIRRMCTAMRRLTEWTSSSRETRDGDLHVGTGAVGACGDDNSSTDRGVILVGQLGDVLGAGRVVLNDGSIAGEGERESEKAQGEAEGAHDG